MRQSQKELGLTILKQEMKAEACRLKSKAKGTDAGVIQANASKSKSKFPSQAEATPSGGSSLNTSQIQP